MIKGLQKEEGACCYCEQTLYKQSADAFQEHVTHGPGGRGGREGALRSTEASFGDHLRRWERGAIAKTTCPGQRVPTTDGTDNRRGFRAPKSSHSQPESHLEPLLGHTFPSG